MLETRSFATLPRRGLKKKAPGEAEVVDHMQYIYRDTFHPPTRSLPQDILHASCDSEARRRLPSLAPEERPGRLLSYLGRLHSLYAYLVHMPDWTSRGNRQICYMCVKGIGDNTVLRGQVLCDSGFLQRSARLREQYG
jgi:hypothetical protein